MLFVEQQQSYLFGNRNGPQILVISAPYTPRCRLERQYKFISEASIFPSEGSECDFIVARYFVIRKCRPIG